MANGDYAEMIELPVSTCEMVVVQKKKRGLFKGLMMRKKKTQPADPMQNEQRVTDDPTAVVAPDTSVQVVPSEIKDQTKNEIPTAETSQAKKFKFSLIGAEVAAIFILVVAILLTNIFWEDSGINVLIRSVFGTEQTTTDERYSGDFTVFAPSKAASLSLSEGVMTFNEAAAIYPPCGGVVESIIESDGAYTITVKHSENFKSIVAGADMLYVSAGDKVYANIPVAHTNGGATVTMYDGGSLITEFMLDGGNIVWQS